MLILPNVGQTKASNATGSQSIQTQTDNSNLSQDFGSLLSAKVGGAKTSLAAPATSTAANGNGVQPAVVASPGQTTADDVATASGEDPLTGVDTGVTPAPLPDNVAVVGKTNVKTATTTADDADPVLDTSAAQTLMALLAQTQPAPVVSRAVGATGDSTNADIANTAQTAGVAGANGDPTQTSNAGLANAGAANPLDVAPATSGALFDQAALLTTLKTQGATATATADGSAPTTLSATVANTTLKSLAPTEAEKHLKAAADSDDAARTAADAGQGLTAALQRDGVNASDTAGLATATGASALSKKSAVTLDTAAATSPIATPTLSAAGGSASTTPAPAAALISAQLGSDEWQQAIGQQVVMFSRNGQQNAELRLHPADLGAVQISLQVDNNQAQIHLSSGHSQVRAALEAALPHLRTALAESGITLGQSSVGSDATPNWGGGNGSANNAASSQRAFTLTQGASTADGVTPAAVSPRSLSGIDTFV